MIACQAPLSMEFSRQEYWRSLPFPTPGDLPYPRIKPVSPAFPALAGRFFTTAQPGKPIAYQESIKFFPNHFLFVCLFVLILVIFWGDSMVKKLSAMQEMHIWSLSLADPLKKKMATHFNILTWEIPWTEEPEKAIVHGVLRESAITEQLNKNKSMFNS